VAPDLFEDEEGAAIRLLFRDISERQQKDAEIRALSRIYEVLSGVNHAVVRVTSRVELLQEVCQIICEVGEFQMAWIGWLDEAGREVAPVAWCGPGGETKHAIPVCAEDDRPEGRGMVATAIYEGRPCIANDYTSDPRTQPWQENAVAFAHRSAISLPIRNGGKICGVLMVYSGETNCFQTKEVELLEEVALDVSFDLGRLDQETLRRKAQEALMKSEEHLRLLISHLHAGVIVHDPDSRIILSNPEAARLLGLSQEQMQGKGATDPAWCFTDEQGKPLSPEAYPVNQVIVTGHPLEGCILGVKHGKNHEKTWILVNAYPEFDADGGLAQVIVMFVDITERKRTEEALRKSEEKFVKAFNTAPAVVAILTLSEGRYIEVNEAFEQISGYSRAETIGHTVLELNILENPQDLERLDQMLVTQGSVRNEEYRYRIKSGEVRVGLISGERIDFEGEPCVIYISLDITERKQMEEKFLRAQRMESIGALAGGMAHDLNNILAPIMMSASMLSEKKLSAETRRQLIAGIEEAAQRGANIVNQVLTFARGVKGQHAVLDTQVLAIQIGQIVKETFPKSIVFSLTLPETLWNITGDSTQLQQVLLNLCVNARDAMPDGGSLDLSVENYEVDSTFAFMVPEAKPGCYVRFRVADAGMGMAKNIVDRIFEPFFTTKEPGKGTGLGLSTVVGIVRSHGGFLKVETEPGKGSVFQVFLPATTDAVPQTGQTDQPSVARGHGETILIVDDEQEIVQIIATVLKQNGWTVVTAADGQEGVAAFLNYSGQIKAVVTDMVMPNLDGLGLIRSIRKLAPNLPILVSSGYSNDQSREALSELRVESFLKKPFSARQLIAEVVSLMYEKGK